MLPPEVTPERPVLSAELSDLLLELSIALQRCAMYPGGHPSLAPAVESVIQRLTHLLLHRTTLSVGVARDQLLVDGVGTDPKHPVLRDMAGRLHRHRLGAVTFYVGVERPELAEALQRLAVDPERSGKPLGQGAREALRLGAHIELHPVTFSRLALLEKQEEAAARGAQLWVGLARVALAGGGDRTVDPETADPTAIAAAIQRHAASPAYDRAVVDYLLQISGELRSAGGAGAELGRHVARLVSAMAPETLRRLLEMGGDWSRRNQFLLDAAQGMSADAVLEILRAAANASGQTISHSLLRMLAKMAAHSGQAGDASRTQADDELREQVRSLISNWTLADPNPEAYGNALETMARARLAPAGDRGLHTPEPLRLVRTAVELDQGSTSLWRSVLAVADGGQASELTNLLDELPPEHETGRKIWQRLTSPDIVRCVVREPVDFTTLDRLLPNLAPPALEPLLDALAQSPNRATRRGLLDRLVQVPVDLAPSLRARLSDERWYVLRNMLVLLDAQPELPPDFSAAPYATHEDARVRREALKLRLKLPAEWSAGLKAGLEDTDPHVVQLALVAAQQQCPPSAMNVIMRRVSEDTFAPGLRPMAIKVLGRSHAPEGLAVLLRLVDGGRTWYGRRKLAPKSPDLLNALAALAGKWARHPRAEAVLARAGRSSDAEIRSAASGGAEV